MQLAENAKKKDKEEVDATAKHIHERVAVRLYQIAEQLQYLKGLLFQSQHNEEKFQKEKFDRLVYKYNLVRKVQPKIGNR